MNRTRYIVRGVLILLTALMLLYLNRKTDHNIGLVAKFRFETLDNVTADSFDAKYKLELLDNAITKFSGQVLEDTEHVRKGVQYLIGLVGLLVLAELGFAIATKRRTDKQTNITTD
jgi:hypothetical protein